MRGRDDHRIANMLLLFMFCMIIPMVLATRILGSASYLGIAYVAGYSIMLASFCIMFWSFPIRITKHDASLWVIYALILILPLINDLIKGISINYFDPVNSVVKIVNFLIFYIVMKGEKINKSALCRFFNVVVIVSVFACIYSFVYEYRDILSIRFTKNTNALKVRSFFSNRNQYSAFLIMALISLLYLQQIQKRKIYFLIMAIQIFGILTTFSRAALFSIIIIFFFLIMQIKQVKKKIMVFFLIIMTVLYLVYTTDLVSVFLDKYLRWEKSGDSGRFTLWSYAWDIVKENFISGVGFYTGADIAVSKGMKMTQFHSMYFDLLVDGGIFELLFILGLLYSAYNRCTKTCPNKLLLAVYRSSFVAFIFHACVESLSVLALSYGDNMYSIFYIAVPLLLSNLQEHNDNAVNNIQ